MKPFVKYFIFIVLFSHQGFAQLTFQKSYTVSGGAAGISGILTNDGGYIISGLRYSPGAGNSDVYLVKTDSLGTIQWTKTYGTAVDDYANAICQTFDGGYILGCNTYTSLGNNDFLLIKIDSIGNLNWSKKYDNSGGGDFIQSVIQTPDSGFVMIGSTTNVVPCCRNDIYVIKTDINGNLVWEKAYHGNDGYEFGMSIQQTIDGDFILSGSKDNTGTGPFYIWLIKIDSSGNKVWERTFVTGRGNSVKQTSDEGYIITGFSSVGYENVILIKTDSLGNIQWEKLYKRNQTIDIASSVEQTTDGGYILTGQTGNLGSYDIFLFKTNAYGDTLWTKYYGGAYDDGSFSVQQTKDGGYAVFGLTDNFPLNNRSVYFIKTDSLGNSGCNEKNIVFTDSTLSEFAIPASSVTTIGASVSVLALLIDSGGVTNTLCSSVGLDQISIEQNIKNIFPNPTTGKITITFSNFVKKGTVSVCNLYGETILQDVLFATTQKEVNLKGNTSGIYFVRLFDGEKYYCKKLIIEQN